MRILRQVAAHLRIYESAQILAPGLFGALSLGVAPPPVVLAAYVVAYGCHVLSVYSYNDLCDWESDADNPRKAGDKGRSRAWLRNQTILLTAIFLGAGAALPAGALGALLVAQVVCMMYSHPRIRLKAIPLGGEAAHFVAGFSYFISGIMVAGGRAGGHLLGGLLFGLLYVSGGTFNEIMDCEPDRRARIRHIVVLAGAGRALRAVRWIHAVCLGLIFLEEPSWLMFGLCSGMGLEYLRISRRLPRRAGDPRALQRFRRGYRMIFGFLLLCVALVRALSVGTGPAAGP